MKETSKIQVVSKKAKKFIKNFGSELFVFVRGIVASLIGFANIVAVLFGFNCFTNIKVAESWEAIAYFFGMIAMTIIFCFVSYVIGLLVKKLASK